MKTLIYHNPNCTKSRAALERLQEEGINLKVIDYLNEPFSIEELKQVVSFMKIDIKKELIRIEEPIVQEKNLAAIIEKASDDDIFELIKQYPMLLQRPIIFHQNKAVIARAPHTLEQVIEL